MRRPNTATLVSFQPRWTELLSLRHPMKRKAAQQWPSQDKGSQSAEAGLPVRTAPFLLPPEPPFYHRNLDPACNSHPPVETLARAHAVSRGPPEVDESLVLHGACQGCNDSTSERLNRQFWGPEVRKAGVDVRAASGSRGAGG